MNKSGSILAAILLGGLVAGTIDVGAAALINGAPVPVILKFIASGLLGKGARGGGADIAVLGLVLQWAMSLVIAAVFVLASLRLPVLRRNWPVWGLAYGVGIYFVMSYVVMPLSAVGHAPKFVMAGFAMNMAAMLVFGLIVAGCARWRLGKA
ncbi:hypothetical protein C5708_05275 [Caulobacter sp. CCUG 60055]|uniref:DUF1440 domain-containing protein n=1 Tax=Caulobacter sp. CCUG 60055 TaxID=2100090 RepID=UPI001FA6FC72|nr:DUF1440 domain-containing protein [Caulobacter sp. CCUG 60055]MBQ1543445.1 hypothetical protein [Caulobacteraceae bacterium]MCI3179660.1 hypothetical protein [Caulobacter sp. CCUG 60055]